MTEKIIDLLEVNKRLAKRETRYRKKHSTEFVCPYCNAFLVPWSWGLGINQWTCECHKNAKSKTIQKLKDSPAWYQIIKENDWSYFNGIKWLHPSRIPILFNPSVRNKIKNFRFGWVEKN